MTRVAAHGASILLGVRRLASCAALLPTLLAVEPAAAAPAAWRTTHLGSEHGLSHNSVFAILQDRQGFLWIGTADGLDRYDGYELVVYRPDPRDEAALVNPIVRSLLEDRAGNLWVGTEDGLDRFDRQQRRFVHYELGGRDVRGTGKTIVWALHEDPWLGVLAGTNRGVFRHDAKTARFVRVPLPAAGDVRAFDRDPAGTLWALIVDERSSPRRAVVAPLPRRGGAPAAAAAPWRLEFDADAASWAMAIDRRGAFWFAPPAAATPQTAPSPAPQRVLRVTGLAAGQHATAAARGRDGSLWLGTDRELCRVRPAGGVVCAPVVAGGSWLDNYVRAIYQDGAGAWWIGTYTGLYRHDPLARPFHHLRHDERDPASLGGDAISAILEDAAGDLWVGTFGAGLDRLDRQGRRATHYRRRAGDPSSLCGEIVWSLLEDAQRRLWIGTDRGLCSLDPDRRSFRAHPLPERDAGTGLVPVSSLAHDRAGRIWAATSLGVYELDPRTAVLRRLAPPPAPAAQVVAENLATTADGALWLDVGGEGLRRYEPASGRWREYPLRTPSGRRWVSEAVLTIYPDRRGDLWLGSGAGLSRLDPASGAVEHWSTREGLPGSVVFGIVDDERGRLWLGTNRGLTRFDPRAPAGQQFRTYDLLDGIGSLEFNRRAAFRGRSGELFFGGVDGLLSFVPSAIRDDPTPPRPALTRIERGRRGGVESLDPYGRARLVLTPADEWVAFEFSALAFAHPPKNRYAHRLEGFDGEWIDAGTRRVARYTSLPPGRYVFQVRAANHDGVWSESAAALPVVVEPPFWRTAWFAGLTVAALGAILYAAYRLRVARLLAVERLRLRIAGDLHDDLSTDLSAIALSADLLRRRAGLDVESSERLVEVRERALGMVAAVRDTVWAVNPQHDTWEALVHRMRRTANELLGESLASFTVELPAEHGPVGLAMADRRTLFLLFKEMVHNASRHARADRVEIALRGDAGGGLELEVRDDGVGFDPAAAAASGGAGVDNLRRRAAELGGEVAITSAPGEGTTVRFRRRSRKSVMGGQVGAS